MLKKTMSLRALSGLDNGQRVTLPDWLAWTAQYILGMSLPVFLLSTFALISILILGIFLRFELRRVDLMRIFEAALSRKIWQRLKNCQVQAESVSKSDLEEACRHFFPNISIEKGLPQTWMKQFLWNLIIGSWNVLNGFFNLPRFLGFVSWESVFSVWHAASHAAWHPAWLLDPSTRSSVRWPSTQEANATSVPYCWDPDQV